MKNSPICNIVKTFLSKSLKIYDKIQQFVNIPQSKIYAIKENVTNNDELDKLIREYIDSIKTLFLDC